MRININNRQLLGYQNEIDSLNNSVLGLLLKGRIKEFNNQNAIRVQSLIAKRDDLYKKYYQTEKKDGREVFKFEGEGPDAGPVLKEGLKEEDFQKEFSELMDKEVQIMI